jgi:hypothetical protein
MIPLEVAVELDIGPMLSSPLRSIAPTSMHRERKQQINRAFFFI